MGYCLYSKFLHWFSDCTYLDTLFWCTQVCRHIYAAYSVGLIKAYILCTPTILLVLHSHYTLSVVLVVLETTFCFSNIISCIIIVPDTYYVLLIRIYLCGPRLTIMSLGYIYKDTIVLVYGTWSFTMTTSRQYCW